MAAEIAAKTLAREIVGLLLAVQVVERQALERERLYKRLIVRPAAPSPCLLALKHRGRTAVVGELFQDELGGLERLFVLPLLLQALRIRQQIAPTH